MSAVGFASRYATTTRGPMRRRVRASCSLPRPRDGVVVNGHAAAHINRFMLNRHEADIAHPTRQTFKPVPK